MILASQGLIIASVIVVLLVIIVVGWYISTMNNLRRLEIKVEEALSGIDVSLTKRYDLLTKMLDTTKGYAKHEKETLDAVISARNTYVSATVPEEQMKAAGEITQALSKIFALSEAYPDLKANTNFIDLQNQLKEIEEKISYARQFYNDSVLMYNNKVENSKYCWNYQVFLCNQMTICKNDSQCQYEAARYYLSYRTKEELIESKKHVFKKDYLDIIDENIKNWKPYNEFIIEELNKRKEYCDLEREICNNSNKKDKKCLKKAKETFDFVLKTAGKHSLLGEQIDNNTLKPNWVIGLGWSHAMFILVLEKIPENFRNFFLF